MSAAAARSDALTFRLHCANCGRALPEQAREPMELIAMFKPSRFSAGLPKTHPQETRDRCRPCGYVNVFHPAVRPSWRAVEIK